MNWILPVITGGIIPLVKYFVRRRDRRCAKREHAARDEERRLERARLRAQTARRIREADASKIDPSKYEVNP